MSRTSDIDLDKYKMSPEAARDLCDQRAADERLRRAFEDPELRAMLAAEGRAVEFTPIPPAPGQLRALVTSPAAAEAKAEPSSVAGTSTPSPWVQEAPRAAEIDVSALPSAAAPATEPVRQSSKAAPTKAQSRGGPQLGEGPAPWTPARKGLAAVAGAFMPAILVLLLLKPKTIVQYVPVPMNGASATATAGQVAPPMASTSATVASSASAAPVAPPSAPPPPMSATAFRPKPRPTSDDPYDAAVPPAASSVPDAAAPAVPTANPSSKMFTPTPPF
jgi:hypothetical protein